MTSASQSALHMAIPKGRMYDGVVRLLADAGIRIVPAAAGPRGYRPAISLPGVELKLLKPQNIIEMLKAPGGGRATRDLGFAGADWVAELDGELVEILDTGLDPVRLVVAAPPASLDGGRLADRPLTIASEYVRLSGDWIRRRGRGDRFVRSYGATEVFPPEDADGIIDITATGATLEANGLTIVEELMPSSTRLYASPTAMRDPSKARRIKELAMLLRAVIEARSRVMLELNVTAARLDAVIEILPCMRRPTLSALSGGALGPGPATAAPEAFAVKAAVPRDRLPTLIPLLKARGGTDIVISPIAQVVP